MASALVTKLRKDPKVRDAEALAAWISRYQKLRKAGVGNKKAMKLAGKEGGMKEGGVKKKDRTTNGKPEKTGDDAIGKYGVDKRTEASLRASEVSGGNDIGNGERRRKNMERSQSFDEKLSGENKAKREQESRASRKIATDHKKIEPGSLVAGFDDKPYEVKRVRGDGTLETDGGTIDPRFTRNVSNDPQAQQIYKDRGNGGTSDPVAKKRKRLGEVEEQIATLEGRGTNTELDKLGEIFHLGRTGGSGRNVGKQNRQRERDLDATINRANKLRPLYEERARLKRDIDNEDSGKNRVKQSAAEIAAFRMIDEFNALKPGDPVPGFPGAIVKKKNAKSIVTEGGSKFTQEEIVGLPRNLIEQLLKRRKT